MNIKQKIIRYILIIIGIIGIFAFFFPMILGARLNIGSVTGIACSMIIFFYGVFITKINNIIVKIYKNSIGKAFIWIICAFVLVIMGLVIVETVCMVGVAGKKPNKEATVVVLGCRVYGERPSRSMVERLDAAYDYLTRVSDSACILSGGQGNGEKISEAQCMYNYLIDKGIDSDRLIVEDKSVNTFENLTFTKQIIEENGLNKEIAIVTSEYHEYRSSLIAKQLGMQYSAIPAHTQIWLLPTYYVRELYGILHFWLFGN